MASARGLLSSPAVRLPVVSPYVRPSLRDGRSVCDNAVTGAVEELPPAARDVLAALWDGPTDAAALTPAIAAHGDGAVGQALGALASSGYVFADRAQADRALAATLDQRRPRVPFVDQIELTNRCPMRCGFCPRGVPDGIQRPTGFMDLELFRRLLEQLHPEQAWYRPLELHHLGESLLHPQVAAFVAEATARGVPTEMSVNPALLTPELGAALLDAGIRRLVVSLDGMDEETLISIRGPAARYGRSERHLDALLDRVATMDAPPAVVIQMIDLARNRHQREAFLARWGRSGLPTVTAYVKDLDGVDPDTGAPGARPLVHLCTYPWRSVVVLWDGRVVPCCRDADAALVLGDLRTQSLEEIWSGAAARQLRAQLQRGDVPCGHLCDGCGWRRERFAASMADRHPDRAAAWPLAW